METKPLNSDAATIAVDIGSTVVKIAHISAAGELVKQSFFPRDFVAGIARQVEALLADLAVGSNDSNVLVASSANGGLRVGVLCLSKIFSGAMLRNQVLAAGANPIFVHDLDEAAGDPSYVDALLVGGGIDCQDAAPLATRLAQLRVENYRYGTLIWAGNSSLTSGLVARYPSCRVVANPLAESLTSRAATVVETLRQAYLDNIVYKEGVSELRATLSNGIRPTPEVVNSGFRRAVFHHSSFDVAGSCILMDIGGATTDIHYTVELVRDNSEERPLAGSSVARYVFTDLGIVASRDNTSLALRTHTRLYEFLDAVLAEDAEHVYRSLREGEHDPSSGLLSYACLFLALDRFASGRGPGLPAADLGKLAQLVLTGGAAQSLDTKIVGRIVDLFTSTSGNIAVQIDHEYRFWVDGITWRDGAPA
jgi:hypothetical protein